VDKPAPCAARRRLSDADIIRLYSGRARAAPPFLLPIQRQSPRAAQDGRDSAPDPLLSDRQVEASDQHGEDRPLRELSGAKALLALKCFATWGVFDFMAEYMDGTTSSSLNEVRLGRERFGKETHAYSVAYADHEIDEVVSHADKIIFNSIGQLTRFGSVRRHHSRPAAQSRRLVLVLRSRRSGAAVLAAGRMGSEKGRAGDGDDLRLHDPQQLRKRRFRPV
jgi:hypothetical protein